MILRKFKERNHKRIGIIVFTITCILLISGVILYRTFAIFEVNETQNIINGTIQDTGDIRFMVYVDEVLEKDVPSKDEGYSLDTSTSYCDNGDLVSWNDEKWSVELKNISTTKTKCYLYFKKIYKEETLNGAIPDLMNGRLIPIQISNSEKPSDISYNGAQAGKVTKANITEEWYKYEKQKWANAVILRDGVVDNYKPGDEIPEGDIESYFVWIPRYSYTLKENESTYNGYDSVIEVGNKDSVSAFYSDNKVNGNKATNSAFEITFETKNDGIKNGTTQGSEHTHPAFIAFDSNGFWVGKFETGYNQNEDNKNVTPNVETWNTTGAEVNEDNGEKVIIKPNVYSWRSIQVANAFYTAYNYKRELESHMMKNTEWGAVAYLTQSIYGRCTSGNCTEISRNNSEYYITGMSTTQEPTCGFTDTKEDCNYYGGPSALNVLDSGNIKSYYFKESQGGSTTGNYSGIYDMSGGAWEYVMGVMQGTNQTSSAPASGRNSSSNSGFKGPYSYCTDNGGSENCNGTSQNTSGKEWPSSKYYDLYDYKKTTVEYQRGILGDATKEAGPFYSVAWPKKDNAYYTRYIGSYNADLAYYVHFGRPWFARGGARPDGTDAGVFAFVYYDGYAYSPDSFRVILTP